MKFKECYAKIENGAMQMPPEVLKVLPQGMELFIRTDIEKNESQFMQKTPLIYRISGFLKNWMPRPRG